MPEGFVGSIGGKLAEQAVAQLYAPAYVFWLGGAAFYAHRHWVDVSALRTGLQESEIIVIAGGALLLVTASAALGQRLESPLIRLLEGYFWHKFPARVLGRRFITRYNDAAAKFQDLAPKIATGRATSGEKQEYVAADIELHELPADVDDMMPTRLGNILRATERRIHAKYGLDPRICWAPLWMVLPKETREDVSGAREGLQVGARCFLWGGLFMLWTIWSWWALFISVAAMLISWFWIVQAAREYGELLESAFDMFRFALYKSLHLPPPSRSEDEARLGGLLTQLLWRGDVPAVYVKD